VSEGSRSVLHVLPHRGGGGETYVDALERMDGYCFTRTVLAPGPRGPRAVRAVVRNGANVPFAARRHDLLHVHGEVASAVCLPSLALRPSVVTLHGLHLLRRLTGARREGARANLRVVVRAARRTICVSDGEYADVLAVVGGRSARRVVVIQNGVVPLAPADPAERAAARASIGLPDGVAAGVWLGSLDEHKDPLVAVRAAVEVAADGSPLALLVAGDGLLRRELQRIASESNGAVRLLGFRRDVREVLLAADFFVLSSRREGLSFSLLEAMSIGLPAVVSDAPGNPEVVGDTGIVVPCGDVAGFAAAFRRLLADEPERLVLGERARDRVAQHFHADDMVRRTREVYGEVVGTLRAR